MGCGFSPYTQSTPSTKERGAGLQTTGLPTKKCVYLSFVMERVRPISAVEIPIWRPSNRQPRAYHDTGKRYGESRNSTKNMDDELGPLAHVIFPSIYMKRVLVFSRVSTRGTHVYAGKTYPPAWQVGLEVTCIHMSQARLQHFYTW